jgi:hypothetical protein
MGQQAMKEAVPNSIVVEVSRLIDPSKPVSEYSQEIRNFLMLTDQNQFVFYAPNTQLVHRFVMTFSGNCVYERISARNFKAEENIEGTVFLNTFWIEKHFSELTKEQLRNIQKIVKGFDLVISQEDEETYRVRAYVFKPPTSRIVVRESLLPYLNSLK